MTSFLLLKIKGETVKNVLVNLFHSITKKMGTGAFKPENRLQKHPSKNNNFNIIQGLPLIKILIIGYW